VAALVALRAGEYHWAPQYGGQHYRGVGVLRLDGTAIGQGNPELSQGSGRGGRIVAGTEL
jgi:hypothetical protein